MYIRYTKPMNPIRITKGKAPRIKRAKREEVPEAYRKKKFIERMSPYLDCLNSYFKKLNPYLTEILLYIIGIVEFIRKGIKYERN